jgi:hypothetical protein
MNRTRGCPNCRREISVNATRCKHCLEEIDAVPSKPISSISTGTGRDVLSEALPVTIPADFASPPSSTQEYRYQVVPFLGTMNTGIFTNENARTVSSQLQRLINQHAEQGWQFYSLEKVNIQTNPGCIGQLLGQSASYITFDQVIFRQATVLVKTSAPEELLA